MFRELDQRRSGGITVTLEWDPATGDVQVRCDADDLHEESFRYSVDSGDARLAFLHPFALRPPGRERDLAVEGRERGGTPAGTKPWRRWFRGRTDATSGGAFGEPAWAWWLT
jgi:hypothetical protein